LEAIATYAISLSSLDISDFSLKYKNQKENDQHLYQILHNCTNLSNLIVTTSVKWKDLHNHNNTVPEIYLTTSQLSYPTNRNNTENENRNTDELAHSLTTNLWSRPSSISSDEIDQINIINDPVNDNNSDENDTTTNHYIYSNAMLSYVFNHYSQNKNEFDAMF